MSAEAIAAVCRLLGVNAREARVEPISGGLSNRAFRVTQGAESWVVRVPREPGAGRFQTVDPRLEERVLVALARVGVAPEVVLHDPVSGALVTRLLQGAVAWSAEAARRPENIVRVAAMLRRVHAVEPPPGLSPFEPARLAEAYLEAARAAASGGTLGAREQRWERELRSLAAAYEARFPPVVLCHHDLVAANILDDGELWLVDFEYALRAHPIADLASLAAMNDYDATQRATLLEAYFGADSEVRGTQLDEAVTLERLLSYFWALSFAGRDGSRELRHFADAMAAMLR